MAQVTIEVTERLKQALQQAADREGVDVRTYISSKLAELEPTEEPDSGLVNHLLHAGPRCDELAKVIPARKSLPRELNL